MYSFLSSPFFDRHSLPCLGDNSLSLVLLYSPIVIYMLYTCIPLPFLTKAGSIHAHPGDLVFLETILLPFHSCLALSPLVMDI